MPPKDQSKGSGFRSRMRGKFGHSFRRSRDQNPDEKSASLDEEKSTVSHSEDTGKESGKKSRREVVEEEFKAAVVELDVVISKIPGEFHVPEEIGLGNVVHIDDVEGTAKKIETAIDVIIARKTKASAESQRMWKNCVKGWFQVAFRYVQPCLKTAVVSSPCRFFILHTNIRLKDVVPSPYGVVISGVLFLLQVALRSSNISYT